MAAAFEMANVACIFVDNHGHVTIINDKARGLLGTDLQIVQEELRPARADEAAVLHRSLSQVLSAAAPPNADFDGSAVLALTRTGKRPLLAHIQRIFDGIDGIDGGFPHSHAVILLDDPEEKFKQRPATLTKLFGLTRVEAEIALLLAQGMSLHEIATHRTVSYETARAHLKSIYRKTDTNRQSELSLLLSNIRMR